MKADSASRLTFRSVSDSDIPLVQRLARQIWHAHYPSIISIEQIEYMLPRMYGAEVIAQELADPATRYELMLLNDEPVGYASYRFEPSSAFISKLYLNPDWHGKGFGQAALARIESEARARQAASIYLFVNKRNDKAIRAYLRHGFAIERAVVKDIGGGFVMDDYEMRKLLL